LSPSGLSVAPNVTVLSDLLDAAARADCPVAQCDAGLFSVGLDPLGADQISEGRTGAPETSAANAELTANAAAELAAAA
jgi:hypothetical protein